MTDALSERAYKNTQLQFVASDDTIAQLQNFVGPDELYDGGLYYILAENDEGETNYLGNQDSGPLRTFGQRGEFRVGSIKDDYPLYFKEVRQTFCVSSVLLPEV